jgi:hypothetical protein
MQQQALRNTSSTSYQQLALENTHPQKSIFSSSLQEQSMFMLELLRDQGRPSDTSNIDFILAMFPKTRQEAECTLILVTFVELVDKDVVL